MAEKPDSGKGGGIDGSYLVQIERYVRLERNPLKVVFRPVALAGTLFSALVLGVFDGFISIVSGLSSVPVRLFEGLTRFITDLIVAVFGVDGPIQAAFLAARADVLGAGIAGFAVGIAVAGSALIIAATGVDLIRG